MAATTNPNAIALNGAAAILLTSGWTSVRELEHVEVSGSLAKWPAAVRFQEPGSGRWIYLPLASVLGIATTNKVETENERQAEQAAIDAQALALFRHQTYAPDRETFNAAGERQRWLCKCGKDLKNGGHVVHFVSHEDEGRGALRCQQRNLQGCSGLPVRYGG